MAQYLMGLDIGGTMTKAALFDTKGSEVAVASKETSTIMPEKGFCERDMDELWLSVANVVRQVIEKAGILPQQILAVGCTGHGKGLYLWGKDGKPVCNAIASTDHRAAAYPAQWERTGVAQAIVEKTYQHPLDCQPPALLAWIQEHCFVLCQNIRWIFEAKDYIRFMLTGEAYAEMTDYSGSGLLNLDTKCFDEELMSLYGLDAFYDCLPPLRQSHQQCGHVSKEAAALTGLQEGTPVSGGMFDIDACAIAMNITNEDPLCVITGTWSINEYLSKQAIIPAETTKNSLFCMPEYYLIEESSPTSAGNLEWFLDSWFGYDKSGRKALYRQLDLEVEYLPPEQSDIVFLPFLYGYNTDRPSGASFVGLDSSHSRPHLLRAIFEGVVFSHRYHIDKLLARRERPSALRIAGGATNSAVWMQMFADVLDMPVEVVQAKEIGALGAAISAAVSVGLYPDYDQAAAAMVRIAPPVRPNAAAHIVYKKKYYRYVDAMKRLSYAL